MHSPLNLIRVCRTVQVRPPPPPPSGNGRRRLCNQVSNKPANQPNHPPKVWGDTTVTAKKSNVARQRARACMQCTKKTNRKQCQANETKRKNKNNQNNKIARRELYSVEVAQNNAIRKVNKFPGKYAVYCPPPHDYTSTCGGATSPRSRTLRYRF